MGYAVAQVVVALPYKPEDREFFHWRNRSGRTMALSSIEPLNEY